MLLSVASSVVEGSKYLNLSDSYTGQNVKITIPRRLC